MYVMLVSAERGIRQSYCPHGKSFRVISTNNYNSSGVCAMAIRENTAKPGVWTKLAGD